MLGIVYTNHDVVEASVIKINFIIYIYHLQSYFIYKDKQ